MVAKMEIGGADELNWVFHQLVTLGTTEADLTVLTALRDELDLACNLIEAVTSDTVHSTECELYVYDPILSRFDGTAQIGWTTFDGASASNAMFNQFAGLTKFFTNVGRRQGRKYMPPITEPDAFGNALGAVPLAAYLAWTAILDDVEVCGAVSCHPCTFNVDAASPLFETTELFNGVTAVDTVPSTQRRRKLAVGI